MFDVVLNFMGDTREGIIENVVRYEIKDKYARFIDDQCNIAYIPLRNTRSICIKQVRNEEDQNVKESGNSANP